MTNYEKFKDELVAIFMGEMGVDKYTRQPMLCEDMDCDRCVSDTCSSYDIRDWLNAEYTEPPKDHLEVATLIAFLRQEPNQLKHVKSIKIVDGLPVINGGE